MGTDFTSKLISALEGIEKAIALKCDKDGNGTIEKSASYDEVGLFNKTLATINEQEQTFIFEGIKYDASGNIKSISNSTPEEVPDKLRVEKPKIPPAPIKMSADAPPPKPSINKAYSVSSQINYKKDMEYDEKALEKAINKMIKSDSKLQGTAADFIKSGKEKGIDPFVVVAVAMTESGRGMSKAAKTKNNVGGIMTRENGRYVNRRFDNVAECIDSMSITLNTRYKAGCSTISKVGNSGKYCAKSVAKQWSSDVANYAEQLRKYYNEFLNTDA